MKKSKGKVKAKTKIEAKVEARRDTDTYTSKDLCERYGCAQVTIRRKETEEGFPHGEKYGRKIIYSKRAVHDWERKHMPGLYTEPELTAEDKHWDRLYRRRQIEREEGAKAS